MSRRSFVIGCYVPRYLSLNVERWLSVGLAKVR